MPIQKRLTEKQINKLKKYWKILKEIESEYEKAIKKLELDMRMKSKIKDLEFCRTSGGEFIGIGNKSKTIELISSIRLEEKDSWLKKK